MNGGNIKERKEGEMRKTKDSLVKEDKLKR